MADKVDFHLWLLKTRRDRGLKSFRVHILLPIQSLLIVTGKGFNITIVLILHWSFKIALLL